MLGEDVAAPLGVIPLGIDLQEFPDTRPTRSADVFSLVCLGRLEARKNFGFLFEVLPKVLSAGCDRVRLTIIGDGPLRARLAAEAHARGVSHAVHFAGALPPATVPMALRRHHMLLHPSLRESFAYALLEAKICGLHTVATADVEVPGEFVDHPVALNPDNWTRVIVSTYQAWTRGSFRQPPEEGIAHLRERYSIRRMVDSYLSVLEGDSVLSAYPRQPAELVAADRRSS
jgi:glycosyltransferase involved in cell wall biosynthesis